DDTPAGIRWISRAAFHRPSTNLGKAEPAGTAAGAIRRDFAAPGGHSVGPLRGVPRLYSRDDQCTGKGPTRRRVPGRRRLLTEATLIGGIPTCRCGRTRRTLHSSGSSAWAGAAATRSIE